jgi:hypothetical protein
MSTITCKYHPKEAARWECGECDITFCGNCVKKDTVRNVALCPVCNQQAEPVNAANFITPFWQRIPKFFSYPANSQSMIFSAIIAFFLSFAFFGGIMSIAVTLILGLGFIRYSLLVLETTADGSDKPPAVTLDTIMAGKLLAVKLLATYVVFGYAVYKVVDLAGPVAGLLLGLFILMCLPASTMVMAVEQSFRQAINPVVLVNVIRAIGGPYFLLYVFLILLSACQGVISAIINSFDSFLLTPVENFVGLYFTLIMYNMMGYVIFQYHEALGHNVRLEVDKDYGNSKPVAQKTESSHPVIQEAEVLIKEGQIDEAIKRLTLASQQAHASNELQAYLHRVLFAANKPDLMIAHAKQYINLLIHENKTRDAAQLIVDCFKFKEILRPNDPDKYYPLAYMLNEIRAFKACITLIQNFHKRYPGHADIPKLYLLASRIMSEELHNDSMALKMLEFLQAKYRQHELAAEIEQYCKVVKNVASG